MGTRATRFIERDYTEMLNLSGEFDLRNDHTVLNKQSNRQELGHNNFAVDSEEFCSPNDGESSACPESRR
jgi:hypothetical protein